MSKVGQKAPDICCNRYKVLGPKPLWHTNPRTRHLTSQNLSQPPRGAPHRQRPLPDSRAPSPRRQAAQSGEFHPRVHCSGTPVCYSYVLLKLPCHYQHHCGRGDSVMHRGMLLRRVLLLRIPLHFIDRELSQKFLLRPQVTVALACEAVLRACTLH